MKVGFIGLGTMGGPAARNIQRKGFDLVVHDIKRDAGNSFLDAGAQWADTPRQLLEMVDVVVSMVFGPVQIKSVAEGEQGLFAADCSGKYWIDLTTSSPTLMRELGSVFTGKGGHVVDAPVTGSVDAAIRGDMIMFVGGQDEDIQAIKPVLDAMGESRRVGKHGNGYVAKLVNNQLWKIHAAAIGEAMVAAKRAGLEPDVWWEAMKGGAADSFVMSHDVPSIFAGHYDPSFPLALCLKDLGLIDSLMKETGVRAELTNATHDRFREAERRYGSGAGEMTVCRVIEDDAGVELRVKGDWTPPWEIKHSTEV